MKLRVEIGVGKGMGKRMHHITMVTGCKQRKGFDPVKAVAEVCTDEILD